MEISTRRGMVAVLLLNAAFTGAVFAQDAGITVSGLGTATARPGIVEIHALVTGDGELASDASVRYRDARRRAVEAIEGLRISSLMIESGGVSVYQQTTAAQQQVVQGMVVTEPAKQKIVVSEPVRLVLKDVEKLDPEKLLETLLRVVDVARDNGLQIGPPPPVMGMPVQMHEIAATPKGTVIYKLADPSGLRERAYKLAVEDARARAGKLAEMSGVKLGRIMSIRDLEMSGPVQGRGIDSGAEATMLGEIPVHVRLSVQFEIVR